MKKFAMYMLATVAATVLCVLPISIASTHFGWGMPQYVLFLISVGGGMFWGNVFYELED